MKGEFVILVGSELVTYDNYDDIPMKFDNLISFKPDALEPPHSEEDHEEMETCDETEGTTGGESEGVKKDKPKRKATEPKGILRPDKRATQERRNQELESKLNAATQVADA